MADSGHRNTIAIVGMSGRFPGANSLDEFWRNVREGVESLDSLTDAQLDEVGVPAAVRANPGFVRKSTVLESAEYFDAGFFGMSPREAQIVDPQQRLFLECAWEAIEHAGYASASLPESVGIYAGTSMNSYLFAQVMRDPALAESVGGYQLMLGNDKDFLCTRASYKLDLRGPSITIQTACSTSLVAVEVACRALQRGECDMALAGGVSVTFPQTAGYLYQEGMIFSPDGHCRPFDIDAKGTRVGAGAGIVVLKRVEDAMAAGDTIHALIRGAAINNDGANKAGYTAPSVDGQVEVIAMAHALAGVDARSITYIEAHGTGTPLGDPIEVAALTQVFRASTTDIGFCRLGSLKANLGHLDAAAGVAGLIKAVLALQHREIPPLVNFRAPNPQLDLERSPFAASASLSEWTTANGAPRFAGVSSFGIGGTNAHVVLQEAPSALITTNATNAQLIVLSAKSADALSAAASNLAHHLETHTSQSFADVAWTLQTGRQPFAHRRFLVARNSADAIAALRQPHSPLVKNSTHDGGIRPVAFMFSGQGSQHAGMGAELYKTNDVYRAAVDRCANILMPHLKCDVRDIMFSSTDRDTINETRFAQPALFVCEYALASMWMHWGVIPAALIGHSIGELVAAHISGVMSLDDALHVVAVRGKLMQSMDPGTMAAVHLSEVDLRRRLADGVEIAAVNAPRLCTVSAPADKMSEFLTSLVADAIDHRALNVSHAFHSASMQPVVMPLVELLRTITLSAPRIPYASNATGTWITAEQAQSPEYYGTQLRNEVKFDAGVRTIAHNPSITLLEVGPGNALASIARMTMGREGASRVVSSLSNVRDARPDDEAVAEAVGHLWLAGTAVNWQRMHEGATRRRVPLPTYPFERKRYWVEPKSNSGATSTTRSNSAPPSTSSTSATTRELGLSFSAQVDDWFYLPTWTRDDTHVAQPPLRPSTWLVFAPDATLSRSLIRRIIDAGSKAVLVEIADEFAQQTTTHFRVRTGETDDITKVTSTVGVVDGAYYLWPSSEHPTSDSSLSTRAFHQLATLIGALDASTRPAPLRVIVATDGVHSVNGEPVRNPWAAFAHGIVVTVADEMNDVDARAVDLVLHGQGADVEGAARALFNESRITDGERIVARRGNQRWMRQLQKIDLPAMSDILPALKRDGVYLITGGVGGVGLSLARYFAEQYHARLLLTTRREFPARPSWDSWLAAHDETDSTSIAIRTVRDIERVGGQVLLATANADDLSQMREAVNLAQAQWGNIDGIVHAAGIAGSGHIILRKTPRDIREMLAAKVDGLSVLVDIFRDTPLDFVVLVGSHNSRQGFPGASDYAGANSIFDAFVDSTNRPQAWKHVATMHFGPWQVGMSTRMGSGVEMRESDIATLKAFLARAIPPAGGAEAFERALASQLTRIFVVPYDFTEVVNHDRARHRTGSVSNRQAISGASQTPNTQISTAPIANRAIELFEPSEIEQRITAIWCDLLGIDTVGPDENFFELGGHSLLATRVIARIDDSLHVRLALRDVFDSPTVRLMAERTATALAQETESASDANDDREEVTI